MLLLYYPASVRISEFFLLQYVLYQIAAKSKPFVQIIDWHSHDFCIPGTCYIFPLKIHETHVNSINYCRATYFSLRWTEIVHGILIAMYKHDDHSAKIHFKLILKSILNLAMYVTTNSKKR